jgi:hypothetical protein
MSTDLTLTADDELQFEPPAQSPDELLARTRAAFPLPSASEFPDPPAGWSLVAFPAPGVASYEVTRVIRSGDPAARGPGLEVCGINAVAFHGFPAETLALSRAGVRGFRDEQGMALRITYRFDYRADGWCGSPLGGKVPVCDFHRLPWGRD